MPPSTTAARTKPQLVVTPVTADDAAVLAPFFREAWEAEATEASVRTWMQEVSAANVTTPGSLPPAMAARLEGRIIGYCGSLPARWWSPAGERRGYWAKGLMVLPEHRAGPIGFLVLQRLARAMELSAAVTVHPASRRLFEGVGYRDLGAMPNYVYPLRAGRMAARLDLRQLPLGGVPAALRTSAALAQRVGVARAGGALVGVGLALASTWRAAAPGLRVRLEARPTAADLDALWARMRPGVDAGTIRDAAALLPRYGDGATHTPYRWALVLRDASVVGAAVVRVPGAYADPRLRGVTVAAVAEAHFDLRDAAAGRATLWAAARLARRLGADAALASGTHRAFGAAARAIGYLPVAGNIHVFLRDAAPATPPFPELLDAWWLTRGDGESDANF
jgi:hypothetical protein